MHTAKPYKFLHQKEGEILNIIVETVDADGNVGCHTYEECFAEETRKDLVIKSEHDESVVGRYSLNMIRAWYPAQDQD